MRSRRMREAVVYIKAAAAGFPVEHAVERHFEVAALVCGATLGVLDFIEAEIHEVAHGSAGLGRAEGIDVLHIAGERVGCTLIVGLRVAEKGRQIADHGKAESRYSRVDRRIAELVERARPRGGSYTE